MRNSSEHSNDLYNLIATEPAGAFPPMKVRVCSQVRVGERDDFAWVELSEPIPTGDGATLSKDVLLGSRYHGFDLDYSRLPIDVYVCAVREPNLIGANELNPADVSILCWALLLNPLDDRTDLGAIYNSITASRGNVFQINPIHK